MCARTLAKGLMLSSIVNNKILVPSGDVPLNCSKFSPTIRKKSVMTKLSRSVGSGGKSDVRALLITFLNVSWHGMA